MIYINEDNLDEWGVLEGTKELNPNNNWAIIKETPRPEIEENEFAYQVAPIKIKNEWVQQWAVRVMTEKEIDIRDNPDKYFPKNENTQNIERMISENSEPISE